MPTEIHLPRSEGGEVPVEHGDHLTRPVEDEVAEAHITPQQDGLALGRSVAAAPVEGLDQRGQRVALRRPLDVAVPTIERVAEARPAQHTLQTRRPPRDGVHGDDRVDQAVVHHPLTRRPGVADVGVEHRRRTRDVTAHPRHGEEGRAEPRRVRLDDSRGWRGHAEGGHRVLHRRLRAQVIVRERGIQRREPDHHPAVARPEVDEQRLVGHAALGVLEPGDRHRDAHLCARYSAVIARPPTALRRPPAPRRRAALRSPWELDPSTAGTRRLATGPSCRPGTAWCPRPHTS